MECQAHHIQVLLTDKLDHYKGKGGKAIDQHIQTWQNTYPDTYQDILQPILINKEKQKEDIIQDKEVLLMIYQCPVQERYYL